MRELISEQGFVAMAQPREWTPQGEGDAHTYTFGDFRIRWLPYAQCWRGVHHGEAVITASDPQAVMDHCEAVNDRLEEWQGSDGLRFPVIQEEA